MRFFDFLLQFFAAILFDYVCCDFVRFTIWFCLIMFAAILILMILFAAILFDFRLCLLYVWLCSIFIKHLFALCLIMWSAFFFDMEFIKLNCLDWIYFCRFIILGWQLWMNKQIMKQIFFLLTWMFLCTTCSKIVEHGWKF